MANPVELDIVAIDLAHFETDTGDPVVVMQLIDSTHLRLNVTMRREHAEAFGESLRDFAATSLEGAR